MSQRDRGKPDWDEEAPDGRDVRPDDMLPSDASEELPTWDEAPRRSSSGTSGSSQAPRNDAVSPSSGRAPMPQLGDALRPSSGRRASSSSYQIYETDESPLPSTDPYERLRRVASRPPRQVRYDDDDSALPPYDHRYETAAALPPLPPVSSRTRRKSLDSRPRDTSSYAATPASTPRTASAGLSAAIATRSADERLLGVAVLVGVISAFLMAVTVAARLSTVADWIPIHVDAAGNVDRWGTDSTLWRLPLFAVMATIVWALLTWFVARKEAVAIQLGLVATILTQTLCWIALFALAW